MAIDYLTALKLIPWDQVARNAPSIIDGSKKLWSAVTKGAQPAATNTDSRMSSLESQVSELRQELISSADLIKALAEQNSHLVQAVGALQARVRMLLGAVAALGAGVVVLAVLLLVR